MSNLPDTPLEGLIKKSAKLGGTAVRKVGLGNTFFFFSVITAGIAW